MTTTELNQYIYASISGCPFVSVKKNDYIKNLEQEPFRYGYFINIFGMKHIFSFIDPIHVCFLSSNQKIILH